MAAGSGRRAPFALEGNYLPTGSLLDYAHPYQEGTGWEWRDVSPWASPMHLHSWSRGRSSVQFILRDPDGRQFPMFVIDTVDLLTRRGIVNAEVQMRDGDLWIVRKRGQNYGLALAPEAKAL